MWCAGRFWKLCRGCPVATIDDQATAIEERDRALALRVRKPEGPVPCGQCYNCGSVLDGAKRWCDAECRDAWQERQK